MRLMMAIRKATEERKRRLRVSLDSRVTRANVFCMQRYQAEQLRPDPLQHRLLFLRWLRPYCADVAKQILLTYIIL